MTHKFKFLIATLMLVFGMALAPVGASASGANNSSTGDDFGKVRARLCNIVAAITGKVGRALATIAVIFLGIGAFFGKVTWGLAVAVSIGIFAIFGASTVVNNFGGTGDCRYDANATSTNP